MGSVRDGAGHRRFRRKRDILRRDVAATGRVCAWCGEPIDVYLPPTDPMSFTADHPIALANGGSLAGQDLEPMHRRCNAMKGDAAEVEIWPAS